MTRSRIVLFRPGALGDTILSIDALAALRSAFSTAVLELVGHGEAAGLLAEAGFVDVVTSFEATAVTDLFLLSPRVAPAWRDAEKVVLWMKSGEQVADAFRAAGVPVVLTAAVETAQGHMADHLVRTLAPLGVGPSSRTPALHPLEALRSTLRSDDSARAPGRAPLLIHPGSGSPRKNWPPDRFAHLVRLLTRDQARRIAVLVGPADRAAAQAVATLAEADGLHLPLMAPPDLRTLASYLAAADMVIGNDSGVSHLSAALGTPTVAIFGPTDPGRWGPRGARVVAPTDDDPWPTVRQVASAIGCLSISKQEQSSAQDQRDQ